MASAKLAFLVGVSTYGASTKNLEFCVDDVNRLALVLERKGFRCLKRLDAPLPEIVDEGILEDFVSNATQESDIVLFYFTGHGADLGGEQLLLGKGVQHRTMRRALTTDDVLPLSRVLSVLGATAAQKIVIVDACRLASVDQEPAADLYKQRTQTMSMLKNCAVVFASADGKASFGTPDNTHSRFTHSLTEELKQYGRGLLSIVEATISRVSRYSDGKTQTPWVYASLQQRPLDGFQIVERPLAKTEMPRHLAGDAVRGIWAILIGSNALAVYHSGSWSRKARLPESLRGGIIGIDARPGGNEYVFVRAWRKALSIVRVHPAAVWDASKVSARAIGAQGMDRYFGALWSPNADRLLAFGAPLKGKVGIRCWHLASGARNCDEAIEGIPYEVDCNAATWINDKQIVVSFCQDESSRSHLYVLESNGRKWTGTSLGMTLQPVKLTALCVNRDGRIYCGGDDGSVSMFDLHESVTPLFFPRSHALSGLNYLGPMPWSGRNRSGDELSQPGVTRMVYDEHTGLLGITYLDGTVAFFDPVLYTIVKTDVLPGHSRRPGIALVGPSTFLAEGEGGVMFEIQQP